MVGGTSGKLVIAIGFALFLGFMLSRVEIGNGPRNPIREDLSASAMQDVRKAHRTVGAVEVREILRRDSRGIIQGLDELGRTNIDESGVSVIVGAWRNARDAEPTLNWRAMENLNVKFALADQLVRAHVNGALDIPTAEVADFGRNHLDAGADVTTVGRAIFIVILAGTEDDVKRVESLVKQTPSNAVFQAGISALSSTCMPEAAQAIKRLQDAERDEFRKSIIGAVVDKSEAFRSSRCSAHQD